MDTGQGILEDNPEMFLLDPQLVPGSLQHQVCSDRSGSVCWHFPHTCTIGLHASNQAIEGLLYWCEHH